MKFSEFLQKYRNNHSLSKKEMAKKIGFTPMYYGRFEKGDLLPTKYNIERFSKSLGIPSKELEIYINNKIKKWVTLRELILDSMAPDIKAKVDLMFYGC